MSSLITWIITFCVFGWKGIAIIMVIAVLSFIPLMLGGKYVSEECIGCLTYFILIVDTIIGLLIFNWLEWVLFKKLELKWQNIGRHPKKIFIFEIKASDGWGCFKVFIEVWYLDDKFLIWHPVLDYSMGYCDGDTNVTYIFLTFTTDTVWRWWLYWKCHIIAVALDVLCSVCNSYLDLANLIEVWKKENDKLIERHFKNIRYQSRRRICEVRH